MEDLKLEEALQLLNYYKNRSTDLEFQALKLQIRLNDIKTPSDTSESKKTK